MHDSINHENADKSIHCGALCVACNESQTRLQLGWLSSFDPFERGNFVMLNDETRE